MIDSAKHPYKPSVRDAAAGFCILVIAGTAAFAAGSPDPEPAPAESAAEDKTAAVTAGTPSAFSEMAQKSTIVAQVMPAASENAPTVSKAGERLAAGGKDETPLEEQIEIDQILQEEEQLEEAPAELEPYERLGMSLDDWNLILVNKEHLIPEDYEFELVDTDDWQRIDERVADDLEEMLQDCRDEGYVPIVCSGYRPIDKQERLFEADVRKFERQGYSEDEAIELTAESVAIPGTSEHEIGLAADIVSEGNRDWTTNRRIRRHSSGSWRTAGDTVSFSAIPGIRKISRASGTSRGTTGMWDMKPRSISGSTICASRSFWG